MTQTAGQAVSYFDRFLSATEGALAMQRVQIVALTCTLLAAKFSEALRSSPKFSEVKMPSLDDLCEVANGKYTKAQLKEMELETLRVLQWELHAVTPYAALEQLEHVGERPPPRKRQEEEPGLERGNPKPNPNLNPDLDSNLNCLCTGRWQERRRVAIQRL